MSDRIARSTARTVTLAGICVAMGCGVGGSTAPDSVNLVFAVSTIGVQLDPDGYSIVIAGTEVSLPSNGDAQAQNVARGSFFEIHGIASNCRLTNQPLSGSLQVRQDQTFELIVLCLQTDPGSIIYNTLGGAIRIRDALGGDLRELIPRGNGVAVAKDGERIAFSFDGDVWTANVDGSNPVNVTNTTLAIEERPTWSPDGTRIAYDRREQSVADPLDIFVINEDGSDPTNLTPDTPDWNDAEPDWSPDGQRIVFRSDRTGEGDLYTMGSDGGDIVRLTDGDLSVNPRWSPDGGRIAFAQFLDPVIGGTDFELFVINADGTGLTQLTNNGDFRTTDADWSPDGQFMVIASLRLSGAGVYDLYMMRADGTEIVRLTFAETASLPRWIP